ncbi:MAG TPA: hypothetical protein VIU15_35805 [Streptomyces sp.]
MLNEFGLFEASESAIQWTVSEMEMLSSGPLRLAVEVPDGVQQVCVSEWPVVEGDEGVPGPLSAHHVANVVESSQELLLAGRRKVRPCLAVI